MKKIFTRKALYVAISLLIVMVVVLAGMKVLSARTYDPANPRSKPNSYFLTYSVDVDLPVERVFEYITYKDHLVWNKIVREHEGQRCEIINSDGLTLGAIILCEEFAEREGTSHRYVVKEVITNRLIHMASEPSIVYAVNKAGEKKQVTTCNSFVYFDMEPLGASKTRLSQTLVIQMPNFVVKFLTDVIDGEKGKEIWMSHLEEELTGMVRFMVAENG